MKDEGIAIAHFDPTKKKKKKKFVLQDAKNDAGESLAKKTESLLDRTGDDEEGDGIVLHSCYPQEGSATFTRMRRLHRQPDHAMAFLLAEPGTSGSLDGQQRLVIKGRFAPKNFEGLLRKYTEDYVKCLGCKSVDTILSNENCLLLVRCEKCGSGRSVAPINAGFVDQVGRRNAGT